jgi:hypothetical protein
LPDEEQPVFKIIKQPLPANITESELREIQTRAAKRREAEALVRKLLGEESNPKMSFEEFILTFPKLDVEDSFFDRHAERERPYVSRRYQCDQ